MSVYTPMCGRSELPARKNAHAQVYAHGQLDAHDTHAQTKQIRSTEDSFRLCVFDELVSVLRESAYYIFFVAISDPDAFDRLQADHSGLRV